MSLHLVAAKPRCSRRDARVLRAAVDRRLAALAGTEERGGLTPAIRYALLAPGKRIRPLLTLLAAAELGADELDALDMGCALEMVHAASLVLDDLPSMDDAPLRRGRPATHVSFGEDAAILAAISLLSMAYGTAACSARLDPDTRCRCTAILAQAVGASGLAAGQYRDLRPAPEATADRIAEANHLKTGALFVAAVEMAAAVAKASDQRARRMRTFARHLGQAFQIRDDLSDGPGIDAPGEDGGKATLLRALGHEEARRRLAHHLSSALDEVEPDGGLARFIGRIFQDEAGDPAFDGRAGRFEAEPQGGAPAQ